MKKENDENNEDISKKMPLDISEIKEDNKSLFCSGVSLDYNNIEQKNPYNTNTYNIKKNFSKNNSKNILELDMKKQSEKLDLKENGKNNESEIKSQNIESNIKILTYIWKPKLLISGYYEFEILFTKKDVLSDKILIQRTLYRSYHDIEILYQGLILYNPGCLIPKLPGNSEGILTKENIEEKKNMLENYLGYICKHIYLSKNPIFLIFISDEFERYRDKINENNNESFSIYSLVKLYLNESYKLSKNFIYSKLLSSSSSNNETYNINGNLSIEISDKRLRNEKLRLEKIVSGTEKFITSLGDEIASVSQKIESMKNLNKISNILKDSNFRVELNQNNMDDNFLNQKNFFSLESVVYLKMAENYEIYVKKIKEIHKNLIKYKEVTEALIEAFIRKEKVEFELKKEKNSDFSMGNEKLGEMAENFRKVEIQFFEELSNYHKNIENMFSVYTNNYIDIKNTTDKKNQIILMNKTLREDTP
jgi:hypothetical protein